MSIFLLAFSMPFPFNSSGHGRLMVSQCEGVISAYSTFSYNIVWALCGVLFITGVPTVVPVLRNAGVTKGASLFYFPSFLYKIRTYEPTLHLFKEYIIVCL